jgi:hypothetical protein
MVRQAIRGMPGDVFRIRQSSSGRLDRAGQDQPDGPAGLRCRQRCGRYPCCHHRTLVEWKTEGQINRLKMTKRQMYGHAKLDLLEARLSGAA